MSSIDKIIKMRSRRLEVERWSCRDLHSIGNYILVESNKWRGLKNNSGSLVLSPIYDSIDVMADVGMCIMQLRKISILYDLLSGSSVDLPQMNSYQRYGSLLEIVTESGVGLYSCRSRKMLIPALYAETTHVGTGRYLWVKLKNGNFAFYDTYTSKLVFCPEGTSSCLDSSEDFMFVVLDNEVKFINQSGGIDSDALRMFALENGGRVKLYNHNERRTVIADIYGHIIN